MYINFKKNLWLWIDVNRITKRLVGFFVSDRSPKSFEELRENIFHIEAKFCTDDKFSVYHVIPGNKHLIGKSNTYAVECMNRFLRHHLARFVRKTYCWSKSLNMIDNSLLLFLFRDSFVSIYF